MTVIFETAGEQIGNNIGSRLTITTQKLPDAVAIAVPGKRENGKRQYSTISFRELDDQSTRVAAGLQRMGIKPGMRIVLLVPPGLEFISLTYSLFKVGATVVLIDPGMGREHMLDCLEAVEPRGFVGIPKAQLARRLYRKRFRKAQFNVTVGRRWLWGGRTLNSLQGAKPDGFQCFQADPDDPAAIIFTTGSTGPPKGVLYRHGNFSNQVDQLRDHYDIQPGEVDLPSFPLFALFNGAMGVTTVIPDMDPTRPANVDPLNIIEAVNDWQVTQAFGSPALWTKVGGHCEKNAVRLPTLKRVLSAGAPVPPRVLRQMKNAIAEDGEMFTPYGCTEALPVASISGAEVLNETEAATNAGKGTCVGRRFSGIEWRVIRIREGEIPTINDVEELPTGEIGELIVRGPVVTTEYVTRIDQNALAKIQDDDCFWHRIGDVGYLDAQDRFWFCGRKAHRVQTDVDELFTIPVEAFFNNHKSVYRSALVGVGRVGEQRPVMIVETWPQHRPKKTEDRKQLLDELFQIAQSHELTKQIRREHLLLHPSLPVDIRHNSKIFREKLAVWAAEELAKH